MSIKELVKNNTKNELLEICQTKNVICKKSWTKTKLAEAIIVKTTPDSKSSKNSIKSRTRKNTHKLSPPKSPCYEINPFTFQLEDTKKISDFSDYVNNIIT